MSNLAQDLIKRTKNERSTTLDLGNCGLNEIPDNIAELTWLEVLSFSKTAFEKTFNIEWEYWRWSETPTRNSGPENRITILPTFLSDLHNLRILNLSGTQITDLSPIRALLERLPVKCWGTGGDEGIYVAGCPLTNPPAEIAQRGNSAIVNYFREREVQGVDHLYEAKLLIVGEGGAGKTSLVRRLYQTEMSLPDESQSTKGIDIIRHEFTLANGRTFRLNVWDFGGQEIYHATHQFFLTKRSLYILLDDTRKDYKSVHDEGFKYWLEVVDQLAGHSPVLIYQNEKGGRSKSIALAEIKGRFDNVINCYKGNLEEPTAADELREAIAHFAQQLPHVGEELPAMWVSIRADIEARAKFEPYIALQDYFDIYARHLASDRKKALHLSRYFHDLGVFLHFQEDALLERTVILQNEWATEAAFKMLNDEHVKASLGRFTWSDCQRIWMDSKYADMHPELLALMQRFELCYRMPDEDIWLAPQLLPPSRPPKLVDWAEPGDLILRYRYEFLPKGIISRLMVRMHRYVQSPDLGWIAGVLFERRSEKTGVTNAVGKTETSYEYTALLAEIPAKGSEIILRARGDERKDLLAVIAADIDALNSSFHGLSERVEKLIPCQCRTCLRSNEPMFFNYRKLQKFRRDGKLTWPCEISYEEMNIRELLDGVDMATLPLWATQDQMTQRAYEQSRKVFISYSKYDKDHKEVLLRHLSGLRGKIMTWNDEDLLPGEEWDTRIRHELATCDIVLYLVTANSIATDYIQLVELPLVEKRCISGECILIPIIVDFCHWTDLEFAKYNALPDKGRPVTDTGHWVNPSMAWSKVVEGIRRIVAEKPPRR